MTEIGLSNSIDIEDPLQLERYLKLEKHISYEVKCSVTKLTGGVSNKTILVETSCGKNWVLKQALSKLRVKSDWFCPPERLLVEAKGLKWIAQELNQEVTPEFIFLDEKQFILAMQAVEAPFKNLKEIFLSRNLSLRLVESMATILANIHSSGKSSEARKLFDNKSFFEILRLESYYLYSAQQEPIVSKFLINLIEETREISETVVHGDFSPKNMLLKNGKIILLDHEVMHYGDPAFDIGFSICHFLSKANWIKSMREDFLLAAKRYWEVYQNAMGGVTAELEARACRHLLACLIARVKGKSPLEYFDEEASLRQWNASLKLVQRGNVSSIVTLLENYKSLLNKHI